MAQSQWTNACCNPFGRSKICDDCRKELAKVPKTISSESELESGCEVYVDVSEPLASLNQYLSEIGETPVSKLKLQQTKYSKQKVRKITTAKKR